MTIPQVTTTVDFALAFEGQRGDVGTDAHVMTLVDMVNPVFFGRAVMQATAELGFIPIAGDGTFVGISQHTHNNDPADTPTAGVAQPPTQPFNVLTKGRIWVFPETTVTLLTNSIFYRHSNAAADPEGPGRFRIDNDGASGDVTEVTSGMRWLTLGAAGTPVLLEINFPQ